MCIRDRSQEEIARALKKAKPSYSSEQVVLARINQRLSALKADFRVTGYTSTDQPGTPQGFGQTQSADNSLGLAYNLSLIHIFRLRRHLM